MCSRAGENPCITKHEILDMLLAGTATTTANMRNAQNILHSWHPNFSCRKQNLYSKKNARSDTPQWTNSQAHLSHGVRRQKHQLRLVQDGMTRYSVLLNKVEVPVHEADGLTINILFDHGQVGVQTDAHCGIKRYLHADGCSVFHTMCPVLMTLGRPSSLTLVGLCMPGRISAVAEVMSEWQGGGCCCMYVHVYKDKQNNGRRRIAATYAVNHLRLGKYLWKTRRWLVLCQSMHIAQCSVVKSTAWSQKATHSHDCRMVYNVHCLLYKESAVQHVTVTTELREGSMCLSNATCLHNHPLLQTENRNMLT